jgi:hypothetical protein
MFITLTPTQTPTPIRNPNPSKQDDPKPTEDGEDANGAGDDGADTEAARRVLGTLGTGAGAAKPLGRRIKGGKKRGRDDEASFDDEDGDGDSRDEIDDLFTGGSRGGAALGIGVPVTAAEAAAGAGQQSEADRKREKKERKRAREAKRERKNKKRRGSGGSSDDDDEGEGESAREGVVAPKIAAADDFVTEALAAIKGKQSKKKSKKGGK